jgi:hypothetical protein
MTACCERLVGCIECNRWNWRGSNRLFMELPEEDLEALKAIQNETAPAWSSLQHLSPLAGFTAPARTLPEGVLG